MEIKMNTTKLINLKAPRVNNTKKKLLLTKINVLKDKCDEI